MEPSSSPPPSPDWREGKAQGDAAWEVLRWAEGTGQRPRPGLLLVCFTEAGYRTPGAEWGRGAQGAAGEDTGDSPAWVSSDKHPGAPGHAGPSPDPLCPDVHIQLSLGWSQSCHSLSSNQRGQEPHSQPGPLASHPSHRGCPGHSGPFWSLLNSPQSVTQQVSPEALAWLLQGHSAPLGPAGPRLQTVGWVRQHDIPPGQAWVH